MRQITEQMDGTWRERSRAELPSDPRPGPRILLEEWIDVWVRLLDEIEPTTRAKYKYGQPALDCRCPVLDGRADCKGDDETEPNYLFLGPKGGHPRRSNYAVRYLTPAAEGSYPPATAPAVRSTSRPSPGRASRSAKATGRPGPPTWPTARGPTSPASSGHTMTGIRTRPGWTRRTSTRSSRWTAAATRWTAPGNLEALTCRILIMLPRRLACCSGFPRIPSGEYSRRQSGAAHCCTRRPIPWWRR